MLISNIVVFMPDERSPLQLDIPEKVRTGYIGQIQPPTHTVQLVELDQHEIDIRIHHCGELHHIIALLHVFDQLIIWSGQKYKKKVSNQDAFGGQAAAASGIRMSAASADSRKTGVSLNMEMQCRKAYVSVNLDVDEEGTIRPRFIRWNGLVTATFQLRQTSTLTLIWITARS
ncbi:MAG: hypothetical protein PUC47_09295 [Oscillospiraceae bacterium]|nr:hypothetical protein [Oscillospiraceae bacterium]